MAYFRIIRLLIVGLLVAMFSYPQLVFGKSACAHIFQSPAIRQMNLTPVGSTVQKNRFVTSRDLLEYQSLLSEKFRMKLQSLDSQSHWVDLGAGKANAQVDFLKSFSDPLQAPLVTAVAYKLDRWFRPPEFSGKLRIQEGAFEKMLTESWKKADLITDVFGVLSYTANLSHNLQKALDLLVVGGELHLFHTSYLTLIEVPTGKPGEFLKVRLGNFLKAISGLDVTEKHGTLWVIKTQEDIIVPQLEIIKLVEDSPPYRLFRVVDN